jgi:hypothetical protein
MNLEPRLPRPTMNSFHASWLVFGLSSYRGSSFAEGSDGGPLSSPTSDQSRGTLPKSELKMEAHG